MATATSEAAVSIGYDCDATGFRSVAIGRSAIASASGSVAVGTNCDSTGINSVAIANQSYAGVTGGIGIGRFATALTGPYTIAIGGGNAAENGAKSNAAASIAIGRNSLAQGAYSVALGAGAEVVTQDHIQLGRNTGSSGSSQLHFHAQLVSDESWNDGVTRSVEIDTTGNFVKSNSSVTFLEESSRSLSKLYQLIGSRSGTGSVTLTLPNGLKPELQTSEAWTSKITIVGRETSGSSNVYHSEEIWSIVEESGTLDNTLIVSSGSYGTGSMAGDSSNVSSTGANVDVVVTTSSTGTTNWTATLFVTGVVAT